MLGDKINRDIFKGINGDLMEFADRISSVLGCPVTIEDGSHGLLAYSMHQETTDQARISTIIGRRVPEKVINSLWKEGIIPALLTSNDPIIVESIKDVGLGKRAAVSIRKNNEILGFIWVLEANKPFTPFDLDFLQFAAKEGKNQLLQLQNRKKRKEESYQEFFWQLLTGHFGSASDIRRKFTHFSLQVPSFFSVAVFEFPEDIDREVERHISYMLTTTQKVKIYFYTIDQKKLILLAGSDLRSDFPLLLKDFIRYFIMEMKTRFSVQDILGISGDIYHDLTNGINSYEEALYTLKIKHAFSDETSQITNYSDLGIYKYFDNLISIGFCNKKNPALQALQNYDDKNQTNLMQTLEIYLLQDCNPNIAAKQLHIHVNTLTYRLKRIAEIGTINLKDPLQKMSLLLEIKLQQYEALQKLNP
ncbi:PucR family transcriptional regulator [Peribacillus sp. SCS-155]|uniref:PucR family transcriptional regulator n=1 Tax=Peribacillus sedimenti TaxID=3115297 RepID=UPI003905B16F